MAWALEPIPISVQKTTQPIEQYEMEVPAGLQETSHPTLRFKANFDYTDSVLNFHGF